MNLDSILENALVNLVAAIPSLLLGLASGWISRYVYERRGVRKAFGLPHARVHIVLSTPLYITPGTNRVRRSSGIPVATIGAVFAYQTVVSLLRRGYPQIRDVGFYFSEDFPPAFYGDNLVLIGFPRTNNVTKDVMERLETPVVFANHAIVERETGQRYEARLADSKIVEDYGCFVRARNPYDARSVVFILAGSQTYGMKAAADYLSSICSPRLMRRLRLSISARNNVSGHRYKEADPHKPRSFYQIILRVHVERYFTSNPEVVSQHSL